MKLAQSLNGASSPKFTKYQIGEAMATPGVPVLVGGAGNEGIALASTTAAVNLLGVTQDAQATLVTAQQSDNSDPERVVTVCVSTDAIYKTRLCGGATAGTDLSPVTTTGASTTGLVVTTGAEWSDPTYDEGVTWGYSGANTGVARKITSVSSTAGTVSVAFPHDIAVGDKFCRAPFAKGELQYVQLTSDLTEIDATVAVDTDNVNFVVVEYELLGAGLEGEKNSYAMIIPYNYAFAL